MAAASVPKAVLYYATDHLWSSAVRLTLLEKGYGPDELDLRLVDLTKAENLSPTFLRLSPQGDVPTLIVPMEDTLTTDSEHRFKAITEPKALISFLDRSRSSQSKTHTQSSAPAPTLTPATFAFVSITTTVITAIHNGADPLMLLLSSAHNNDQLRLLGQQHLPSVLSKQKAISAYIESANQGQIHVSEKVVSLWNDQLSSYQHFIDVLSGDADLDQTADYFASVTSMNNTVKDVLQLLDKEIVGPFLLGEQLSLGDLHLAAWIVHIVRVSGGSSGEQGSAAVSRIEEAYNAQFAKESVMLEPSTTDNPTEKRSKLAVWWDTMRTRDSWKAVFGET